MRISQILRKELLCIREDISFNMATLVSPLLFLIAFMVMLSGGITLPVQVSPGASDSPFIANLNSYKAPDGTPYFTLQERNVSLPPKSSAVDWIVVTDEPVKSDHVFTGKIQHYVNDVNENMTKNYRNRLSGAVLAHIETHRTQGNVVIKETTRYKRDIPWDTGIGASIFVFGLVLSGLLFGMLSITGEWENKTTLLLKLSPCAPHIPIIGKLLAGIVKCFISGLAFLLIFFAFSKAFPMHVLPLIFTLFLVYTIFICIGLCLGIYVKSTLTAFLVSLTTALTLWVGGGGFGPLSYFGRLANVLGRFNPATYAIDLVRWSYFSGTLTLTRHYLILLLFAGAAPALLFVVYTRWVRSEEGRQ